MPAFRAEEDENGIFADLLVRASASAALFAGRKVFFLGSHPDLESLPSKVEAEVTPVTPSTSEIAWRYASLSPLENTLATSKHSYDFASKLTQEKLRKHGISSESLQAVALQDILSGKWDQANACLIVAGANAFPCPWSLTALLFRLKSLSRRATGCTVLATLHSQLESEKTRQQVHDLADTVLHLQAFRDPSPSYPDFEGLFLIHKLPRVNSLALSKKIETLDLGFQMKKQHRFFEVDKLSLPPDLSEDASRSTCAAPVIGKRSQPINLDF